MLYNRPRYSLDASWVVYACPQSNFKLHPDFDVAAARILNSVPSSRLIMVHDRRRAWTQQVRVSVHCASVYYAYAVGARRTLGYVRMLWSLTSFCMYWTLTWNTLFSMYVFKIANARLVVICSRYPTAYTCAIVCVAAVLPRSCKRVCERVWEQRTIRLCFTLVYLTATTSWHCSQ